MSLGFLKRYYFMFEFIIDNPEGRKERYRDPMDLDQNPASLPDNTSVAP